MYCENIGRNGRCPRKSSKMTVRKSKHSEIAYAFRDLCRRRQIKIYHESLSSSKCISLPQISTMTIDISCQSPYRTESCSWSRRYLDARFFCSERRSVRWHFRSVCQKHLGIPPRDMINDVKFVNSSFSHSVVTVSFHILLIGRWTLRQNKIHSINW